MSLAEMLNVGYVLICSSVCQLVYSLLHMQQPMWFDYLMTFIIDILFVIPVRLVLSYKETPPSSVTEQHLINEI